MDPDGLLVRRAPRGDRIAFERLVERHQHRLFTLAARRSARARTPRTRCRRRSSARGGTSPPFRGGALFSTWLYRICVNAAHDLRAQRAARALEAAVETPDPRDRFVDSELSGGLQAALNGLDETAYRTAVVLYDVLGCSYAEIAEITGVAEGTVKSRIFRGRNELARGTRNIRAGEGVEGVMAGMHPEELELLAYLEGELDDPRRGQVASHLETCDRCAHELRAVEAGSAALRSAPLLELSPERRDAMLTRLPSRATTPPGLIRRVLPVGRCAGRRRRARRRRLRARDERRGRR